MSQLLRPKNADVEAGFTLIELLIAVSVIVVVFAMAFESFQNALPSMRANTAMQLLEAQLRQAREASIDQRRNVTVTFKGTSELVGYVQGGTPTLLYDYFLPERFAYTVLTGVADTPDGYGNASPGVYGCSSSSLTTVYSPVYASGSCTLTFQSDGSVLNSSGSYVNGSIFIGITGQTQTARAVNILSATGKIKGWHYNGTAWN
jgi:prepilin-type N-terminal cleavage/methylation domain-containing protein